MIKRKKKTPKIHCSIFSCRNHCSPTRMMAAELKNKDNLSEFKITNLEDGKLLSPRSIYSTSCYSSNASDIDSQLTYRQLMCDETDNTLWYRSGWNGSDSYLHRFSDSERTIRSAKPSINNNKNYTFTDMRLREIERTNTYLMRQIMKAKPDKSTTGQQRSISVPTIKSTATINRQKKEREINRTNSILMAKLQAISLKKTKKINK